MAKDRFYRSKPHVNVAARFPLGQLGFSAPGVFQISHGQAVTDPRDRQLAAEILGSTSGLPTGKRQHTPYSVTKPQDRLVLDGLRRIGITPHGIQQIGQGQPLTNYEDRERVCAALAKGKGKEVVYYTITLTE